MLQRDFPGKEIIIPTVMNGPQYGSWIHTPTGLKASEAIAELQLKIATKFGLKCVPLFWLIDNTRRLFTKDAVHPNINGALRIQAAFVETLCLSL